MNERVESPAAAATEDGLDPVALTGRLTAAMRARESERRDRLFDDPFAARLAGEQGQALLDVFGDNVVIAVRTRFFDDAVAAISGVDQIVILAAGMDTRAYRLDCLAGRTLFELDRAEVLRLKDQLLGQTRDVAPQPRCDRRPIGVDLAADWTGPLVDAGFEPERPTCWLVEGLTPYLTEPDVHRLLDRVSALAATGSHLLVDMVGQSFFDSPETRPMLDLFAERDMTWQFGTDQPEDLLTERGWQPDVTLISAAGTRLGRWPYPHVPRGTPGIGQGFFVHARRP